jgi:flagellar protein FlaG
MSIGAIQDSGNLGAAVATRSATSNPQPRVSQASTQASKVDNGSAQSAKQNSQAGLSVEQAVDRLKQFVATSDAEINFAVDNTSGVQIVKIVDRNTKDVIRQIPSEEAISLAMALDKLQGLFVREKA